MTPSFSSLASLENLPPPSRSVRHQKTSLSQPCSSHLRHPDIHFLPSRTLSRTYSRPPFRSHAPATQTSSQDGPRTFRISPQPRTNQPWAAASFNPGMQRTRGRCHHISKSFLDSSAPGYRAPAFSAFLDLLEPSLFRPTPRGTISNTFG